MTTATAQIRTASDVAALGTVLGIWAHPDDEAYLSGGLMALARDAGQRVVCLTATRGELGTTDPWRWPPHQLAVERTAELARCLDLLGRPEHRWLGFADGRCLPDGGCADADPEPIVDRLAALIDEIRPDTVLTFGPDGLTGHRVFFFFFWKLVYTEILATKSEAAKRELEIKKKKSRKYIEWLVAQKG